MKILEKDLFNFIFHPEILDEKKHFYLKNGNNFIKEIEFLRNIKRYYKEKISKEIINKIKESIAKKNNFKIIKLSKIINYNAPKSNDLVLAADSPKLNKKQSIETFEDEDSKYLIKIICSPTSNKIYLFNKDDEEMHNVKLYLEPSGESYIMESSRKPLILSPKQEITNISLTAEY